MSLLFLLIFAFLVGSFLNVIIHRFPIMLNRQWKAECKLLLNENKLDDEAKYSLNLALPRSHCPKCGYTLRILENIPILSYLILKGKCKSCGESISLRYFLVEILSVVLSVILFFIFGWSIQLFASLILTWGLISLTFIDIEHRILPDEITIGLLWLGILCNLSDLFCSLHDAVLGAVFGYLFFWFMSKAFTLSMKLLSKLAIVFSSIKLHAYFKTLSQRESMGHGDFKLLAAGGAWFGWQTLPFIVVVAAFLGILVGGGLILFRRKHDTVIAFGPYLAVAIWVTLLAIYTVDSQPLLWM